MIFRAAFSVFHSCFFAGAKRRQKELRSSRAANDTTEMKFGGKIKI